MSQFTFRAGRNLECLVGWDPPLNTFYGQVYRTDSEGRIDEDEDGNDGTILWVGTEYAEVLTVDELEDRLRPIVQMLPGRIYRRLGLFLTEKPVIRPAIAQVENEGKGV